MALNNEEPIFSETVRRHHALLDWQNEKVNNEKCLKELNFSEEEKKWRLGSNN